MFVVWDLYDCNVRGATLVYDLEGIPPERAAAATTCVGLCRRISPVCQLATRRVVWRACSDREIEYKVKTVVTVALRKETDIWRERGGRLR